MSDIAIRVENLSKRYRIGLKEEIKDTFVGAIGSVVLNPLKNLRQLQSLSRFGTNDEAEDILWALRDVSFEVKRGEVIGVIGRNGAGKSTLLKILSRITHPTSGRVELNGRVASLLEVGTGFHPELTGRENIYLNGTILGMRKKEIDKKLDEIIDFSGVEKFIDTPVKRYSSGMRVRLAFSVAAYLEPEILLIDEVLAVGDAEFQKKCLGKIGEVAKGGRTVLFVSHNLGAIVQLCKKVSVIESGEISYWGHPDGAIKDYLGRGEKLLPIAGQHVSFGQPYLLSGDQSINSVKIGESFSLSCKIEISKNLDSFRLIGIIKSMDGTIIVHGKTDQHEIPALMEKGVFNISMNFPGIWPKPSSYNFYFKLLAYEDESGNSRHLSDSILLNFEGDVSREALNGVLTPQTSWSIE